MLQALLCLAKQLLQYPGMTSIAIEHSVSQLHYSVGIMVKLDPQQQ